MIQRSSACTPPPQVPVASSVNGKPVRPSVPPWTALLDLVREQLGLTGSKKGCDHGQCGARTMLVDGGSCTAASSSAAVHLACERLKEKRVFAAHKVRGRPLGRAAPDEVRSTDGRIVRLLKVAAAGTISGPEDRTQPAAGGW